MGRERYSHGSFHSVAVRQNVRHSYPSSDEHLRNVDKKQARFDGYEWCGTNQEVGDQVQPMRHWNEATLHLRKYFDSVLKAEVSRKKRLRTDAKNTYPACSRHCRRHGS